MQKPRESAGLRARAAGSGAAPGRLVRIALGLLLLVACSKVPALPDLDAPEGQFSPALATAHYGQLASLGPRPPGSEAAALARAYLARALRRAGAEVETLDGPAGGRHLLAWRSGRSRDRVLLVVPWSEGRAASSPDDASAALALELVRAVSTRPEPPYEIVFAFAEVRAERPSPGGAPRGADAVASDGRAPVQQAGEDLIRGMRDGGWLEGVRGVIVLEPRAGGPTRMARDLRSHPVFRSIFWRAAADLGLETLFPSQAAWSAPDGLQGALHAAGIGAVLAMVDERVARPRRAPAVRATGGGAGPSGAPIADWARVGLVADEGLTRLMRRFERVDAFAPPGDD